MFVFLCNDTIKQTFFKCQYHRISGHLKNVCFIVSLHKSIFFPTTHVKDPQRNLIQFIYKEARPIQHTPIIYGSPYNILSLNTPRHSQVTIHLSNSDKTRAFQIKSTFLARAEMKFSPKVESCWLKRESRRQFAFWRHASRRDLLFNGGHALPQNCWKLIMKKHIFFTPTHSLNTHTYL